MMSFSAVGLLAHPRTAGVFETLRNRKAKSYAKVSMAERRTRLDDHAGDGYHRRPRWTGRQQRTSDLFLYRRRGWQPTSPRRDSRPGRQPLWHNPFQGAAYGAGNVYQLSPNSDGTWKETTLYNFTGGNDGGWVDWGELTFDATGNLYGVTVFAGRYGQGVLFQVTPNSDGSWSESVLHQFSGGYDGAQPRTVPYFDVQGNLYGTAAYGGAGGCGTVYKLTPGAGNKWSFLPIYQFSGRPACSPWVGLVPDTNGNLYGTTRNTVGGCSNPPQDCGTVFELSPAAAGQWTFRVIHRFVGSDGSDPSVSGLILGDNGNLYGVTEHGGNGSAGVLYELISGPNSTWSYKVLHHFKAATEGSDPIGQLVLDPAGNIYGTANIGGTYGFGTIFQASAGSDGSWGFKLLHTFSGGDGAYPLALTWGTAGTIYGTTAGGGDFGAGAVFEVTP
jgi:uncharacterized repeat protein (TIGR03803 family)